MEINKQVVFGSVTACVLILSISLAASLIASQINSESQTNADVKWGERITPVADSYQYGRFSFTDAAILGDGEVWAVGYDGHDPERAYFSKDGGNNWEVRKIPTAGWNVQAINFVNQKNGWAVGSFGLALHTTDGGQTWERLERLTDYELNKVHFANPMIGYITGRKEVYDRAAQTSTFSVVILKTSDGGKTWRTCYENNNTASIWQIVALSEKHAVVVMDGNYLLRTEDSGSSWQVVSPKVKAGFLSVAFTVTGSGWAVGEKGAVYYSSDQAKTWRKVTELPEALLKCNWWCIDFADDKRGMIVGNSGAIALTRNGGRTWVKLDAKLTEDLRLVRLRGNTGLIAGAQRIYQVSNKD